MKVTVTEVPDVPDVPDELLAEEYAALERERVDSGWRVDFARGWAEEVDLRAPRGPDDERLARRAERARGALNEWKTGAAMYLRLRFELPPAALVRDVVLHRVPPCLLGRSPRLDTIRLSGGPPPDNARRAGSVVHVGRTRDLHGLLVRPPTMHRSRWIRGERHVLPRETGGRQGRTGPTFQRLAPWLRTLDVPATDYVARRFFGVRARWVAYDWVETLELGVVAPRVAHAALGSPANPSATIAFQWRAWEPRPPALALPDPVRTVVEIRAGEQIRAGQVVAVDGQGRAVAVRASDLLEELLGDDDG